MNILKESLNTIKRNYRSYITINILYYGIMLLAMLVPVAFPSVQEELNKTIAQSFNQGMMSSVAGAYSSGNVFAAALVTFLVNLLLGTLVVITVPSTFIPFFGIFMGLFRATLWGLLFSPAHSQIGWALLPHSITILIEGQGYIIAMFAAYLLWRSCLLPKTAGIQTQGVGAYIEGYIAGLRQTGLLYILVSLVLLVAAVYEAIEVIAMMAITR